MSIISSIDPRAGAMSAGEPPKVDVVTDEAGIRALEPDWRRLEWYAQYEFEFYLYRLSSPHTRHLSPRVYVLRRGARVEAILAGYVASTPVDWKLGYRKLVKRPVPTLDFDYGSIMGAIEAEGAAALVRAILDDLRRGTADIAVLRYLDTGSPLEAAARRVPGFVSRSHVPQRLEHWYLDISGGYDAVIKSRSSNVRQNMRRDANLIEREFGDRISVRVFAKPEEVATAIDHIEQVAKTSFQRAFGGGFVASDLVRDEWASAADRDRLRVYVCYVDGEPIAFCSGFAFAGTHTLDYTAYDPRFAKYGFGRMLLLRLIRTACDMGLSSIDYGFTHADYKAKFGSSRKTQEMMVLCAPTLAGVRMQATRLATTGVTMGAKSLLARTKRLGEVKAAVRRRLVLQREKI